MKTERGRGLACGSVTAEAATSHATGRSSAARGLVWWHDHAKGRGRAGTKTAVGRWEGGALVCSPQLPARSADTPSPPRHQAVRPPRATQGALAAGRTGGQQANTGERGGTRRNGQGWEGEGGRGGPTWVVTSHAGRPHRGSRQPAQHGGRDCCHRDHPGQGAGQPARGLAVGGGWST